MERIRHGASGHELFPSRPLQPDGAQNGLAFVMLAEGEWCTEQRHESVAEELVDRAPRSGGLQQERWSEEPVDELVHRLGAQPSRRSCVEPAMSQNTTVSRLCSLLERAAIGEDALGQVGRRVKLIGDANRSGQRQAGAAAGARRSRGRIGCREQRSCRKPRMLGPYVPPAAADVNVGGQDAVSAHTFSLRRQAELDLFRWARRSDRAASHSRHRRSPCLLRTVAVARHYLVRKLPEEFECQVRAIADQPPGGGRRGARGASAAVAAIAEAERGAFLNSAIAREQLSLRHHGQAAFDAVEALADLDGPGVDDVGFTACITSPSRKITSPGAARRRSMSA